MIEKLQCDFCRANLEEVYASSRLDEMKICPTCGALIMFTTDLENVRREVAEVILRKDYVTLDEAAAVEVRIIPDIDILLDEPGGEEVDRVSMVIGWDPNEILTTEQVARILGISRGRVCHLAAAGKFPGAVHAPPRSRRSKQGREWLIPRRSIKR